MTRPVLATLVLAAALAHAQGVGSTVSPRPGVVGATFTNRFCNGTGGVVYFTSSAPWAIRDRAGNLVFGPAGLPVVLPLANGACQTFSWNGRDGNGQPVPAGLYLWEVWWLDAGQNPQPPLVTCFEITDAQVTVCANRTTVPVSCPVQLTFTSPLSAGLPYVAASSLGSVLGIPLDGCRSVPLDFDGLLLVSLCSSGPVFVGYCGVLDGRGTALAEVRTPPDVRLVGTSFDTSFVTIAPGGGIRSIAAALRVTIGSPSPPCVFCR